MMRASSLMKIAASLERGVERAPGPKLTSQVRQLESARSRTRREILRTTHGRLG